MEDNLGASEHSAPDSAVETGNSFLRALFVETDTILFRPIETWTEGEKKHSRVDYRNTCYRRAAPVLLQVTVQQLLKLAAPERLNLFFGACPRFGAKGRFDQAWQIRIVRALWTDIDNVTVAEVRERVAKAGLPPPSIVVNSGNGAHLYWLLDEPYLIDDAGDPLPHHRGQREEPRPESTHRVGMPRAVDHRPDPVVPAAGPVGIDPRRELAHLLHHREHARRQPRSGHPQRRDQPLLRGRS